MNSKLLLGWGLGSFTTSVLVSSVGLLHLRFMTDSLGIGVGLAGTLIALAKTYDAAADPVMGLISDQTRSRWGRHRPYLFAGALLSALSMIMMFNVPEAAAGPWLIAYVAGVLILYSTAYTMFRIPYLAMAPELGSGFEQRSRLITFSVYGSAVGSLFATSAAPFLLARTGSGRAGHALMAWILGALIAVGGVACCALLRTTPRPQAPRQHMSLMARLAAVRENRPFTLLIIFKVTMFTGLSLHGAAIPFYTRHVIKASDVSLGTYFLCQTLAMMASQLIWTRLASRFGRRNSLIGAALLQTLIMILWTTVPPSAPLPWLPMLGVAEGICAGGLFFGLYTVVADTMAHDKHQTGKDREGAFAGIFVMVEKITAAAGTAIFGAILSAAGFVSAHNAGAAEQPTAVAKGIIFALAVLPALTSLLACLALKGYRLVNLPEGAAANTAARAGAAEG